MNHTIHSLQKNFLSNNNYMPSSFKNFIIKWWKSIDKFLFISVIFLIIFGAFFIFLNSRYVAMQHNWNQYIFVKKHLLFCVMSLFILIGLSMMSNRSIFNFLFIVFVTCTVLLILVPLIGVKIKGARRWISIFGFSLQPSEFFKPTLPVLTSYLIVNRQYWRNFIHLYCVYPVIFGALLFQPDFGMTFILLSSIFCQLFVENIRWKYVVGFVMGILVVIAISYLTIPHVHKRIDSFVTKSTNEDDKFGIKFQSYKSMQVIHSGGLTGKGLGGGIVKKNLPDLHADFIFAGIVEDVGLIISLIIILLYFLMILRIFSKIYKMNSCVISICMVGLAACFGMQILINLGSNIGIIPPKGTTLPFLSYGGSAIFSCSILMGSIIGFIRNENCKISENNAVKNPYVI